VQIVSAAQGQGIKKRNETVAFYKQMVRSYILGDRHSKQLFSQKWADSPLGVTASNEKFWTLKNAKRECCIPTTTFHDYFF